MIADLKPYPEYKESGSPWLGRVPAHWDLRRLKYLLHEVNDRSLDGEERLLSVSQYTGVTPRRTLEGSEEHETRATSLVGYKKVAVNDLAINIMLAWNGSLGVSPWEGVVSPAYCVYRFADGLSPLFFHNLLRSPSYKVRIKQTSRGVVESRLRLYTEDLGRIEALLPPPSEQAAIVRFLDWANGRLERAIRAKRKVIALLNEQKQAIIHRAVTRGLNPNVPLKPSGIPWLREIPKHWGVRRLRTVADLIVSNVDKLTTLDQTSVRLCNYVDAYKNERITEHLPFMRATASMDEIRRFRIWRGDVLITKDSEEWDDIGVPSLVEYEAPDLVCGYHLGILRLKHGCVAGSFLHRVLQCKIIAAQLHVAANGVTRYGLSQHAIKDILVPLPPFGEQETIVLSIGADLAAFEAEENAAEREIALLREYRTRLVADVVTGKLDVRDAAKKLPEEEEDKNSDESDLPEVSDDSNLDTKPLPEEAS